MPDTTTTPNPSEPASQEGSPTARFTFDSGPRQEMWPTRELVPGVPLPPPWPSSPPDPATTRAANSMDATGGSGDTDDGAGERMEIPLRRPDPAATRPLFAPEQWVSDPDFWESKTLIALTGRHPVPRPRTIPLQPPQRFHQMARWKSILILVFVCVLILFSVICVVEIGRLGSQVLGPSPHITPTAVPAHTIAAPTATPHKK